MTLTEFLLARIAEDEATARQSETTWASVPSTKRMLAECEAKRQIVAARPSIGLPDLPGGAAPGTLEAIHDEVKRQRDYVFRYLALPYADHPDYDETWRP